MAAKKKYGGDPDWFQFQKQVILLERQAGRGGAEQIKAEEDLVVTVAAEILSKKYGLDKVLEFPVSWLGMNSMETQRGYADNFLAYDVKREIEKRGIEPPDEYDIRNTIRDLEGRLRIIRCMYRDKNWLHPGRDGEWRF